MRQLTVLNCCAVSVIALSVSPVHAGDLFFSRQTTCNKHCLDSLYNYQHDTPRFSNTEFAVAKQPNKGSGAVEHKPFHFRATKLDVDHLHLDQVGLSIYRFDNTTKTSHGTIVASGRILNDGGDGGIIGSNVTIRIRAYIADNADPVRVPPDAFMIWESEHNLWVSRGNAQKFSLIPKTLTQPEKLSTHFDEITHLVVEMEYRKDR
ncbi:MAG: hypothetical protein COA78_04790 [Blastopirellula sp.]|nr:MAG: hypothetical protein COA78_04790 [Blastopirellula sp.]